MAAPHPRPPSHPPSHTLLREVPPPTHLPASPPSLQRACLALLADPHHQVGREVTFDQAVKWIKRQGDLTAIDRCAHSCF